MNGSRRLKKSFGIVFAFGILVFGIAKPLPFFTNSKTQLVFSIFLSTIVLWISKPVPYTVSSILSVILLHSLGVTDTFSEAASGFSSNLVFFLILIFLIGRSVDKVNLDVWLATRLVSSVSTPQESIRRLTLAILSLAFLMPSGVARTVTMIPVIDKITEMYSIGKNSQFRQMSYFVIGHVNPIMSLALMTGGGVAVITSELINKSVRSFTWLEWAIYMIPPVVSLFLISVLIATVVYDIDDETSIENKASVEEQPANFADDNGASLSQDQQIVIGTLLIAVVFWIIGSFLGIPTVVPAMFVVFVFSLPGVRVITAQEAKSLSWGMIFLTGAMLSILDIMEEMNSFDPLMDSIASALPMHTSVPILIGLLFSSAVVLRLFFSSVSAAYIVLFPIMMEFAGLFSVSSLYMALSLSILLVSATFLPFNSPPVLIAYERGPLSMRSVLILGLVTLSMGSVIIILSWSFYWPFVDIIVPL